jgi:hypothetical protein
MRERIKALETENKDLAEKASKGERMERQLAIRDADLSLKPMQMTALERVHEGDWTADSIRETAVALGFVAEAPPEVPPEELARLSRIDAASAGARNAGTPVDRDQEFEARLRAAKSDDEFMAIYRESGRPIAR